MRNQSLAIAVFAELLSIQGFAAAAEAPAVAKTAAPAPAAPAPAPAAPAPARPAPVPAPAPAANNSRPAQPPARPAQNGANPNNSGPARTPVGNNEQGRATGSTLPPANAQEAQNRLRANEQRTAQNGQGRDERRWGRGRRDGSTVFYGGYLPNSWWFNGNSYWTRSYGDDVQNDNQQAANGSSTPAAPAQNVPTPGGAATPAQDQAKAVNQLEAAPSYRQAVADMAKAQAAYDSASGKALEKLKKNPEYQALVKQRDHAEDKVEAVQAAAKIPSPAQVTPIAQQKLNVSSKITHMEQDAIQADPDAAAAKSRLVDLNAQVQTFKKQAQNAGQ